MKSALLLKPNQWVNAECSTFMTSLIITIIQQTYITPYPGLMGNFMVLSRKRDKHTWTHTTKHAKLQSADCLMR